MCCRLHVVPLDITIAETILAVGMFTPSAGSNNLHWERLILEELVTVSVSLMADGEYGKFLLNLSPSISSYDHHKDKRIAAGVYFEIAAKYAEKVGGEIYQTANISGCIENGSSTRKLASYPSTPMQWNKVCNGFREVILGPTSFLDL